VFDGAIYSGLAVDLGKSSTYVVAWPLDNSAAQAPGSGDEYLYKPLLIGAS